MKLEATERMLLLQLIANAVGNLDAMHTLRRVRGMIGFSGDEMTKQLEDIEAREFWLDDWTKTYIGDELAKLDQAGKLSQAWLPLTDKFLFRDFSDRLEKLDDDTHEKLKGQRVGHKSVALVGLSPRSCGMAPFDDDDIEIWGENESHAFSFFKRYDRWFQMHDSYKQATAKRGIKGHYDWLKAETVPIYTPRVRKDIPASAEYPLEDVCATYLSRIERGYKRIKYFNSSFDYMVGLALQQGFNRIEIYGFDMAGDNEYSLQKPSAEFWLGVASQYADVWMPDNCLLLKGELYGGAEQGEAWR